MLFILKTNIQIAIFSGWLIFLSYSSGLAVQDEAHDIRAKIQTQKKMVNTFSQKEVDILDGLNKIDQELNKTHIKALAMLQDVKLREKKIWQLGRDKDQLLKKIGLTEKYTEKRLIALYKMNMIGKLDVAGRPSSVFDFFVQQNSMKRIIYSDFKILENQTSDLEKFETLEQKLKKEIQAKIILEETLNAQIRHNKKEGYLFGGQRLPGCDMT